MSFQHVGEGVGTPLSFPVPLYVPLSLDKSRGWVESGGFAVDDPYGEEACLQLASLARPAPSPVCTMTHLMRSNTVLL